MLRFFTAVVLLLAVLGIITRFAELEQIAETLRGGRLAWLAAALVVQVLWVISNALNYRAIYHLLGLPARMGNMLPLAITSNFFNIAAPTGGVGGVAVFISDARRRGLPAARVTIASALYVLSHYFAVLCYLALGLGVLFRRNNLTGVELGATVVLLAMALALAGVLVLGATAPARFEGVLRRATLAVNRLLYPLLRRPYLSEARAHNFAVEAAAGLAALDTNPRKYVWPALIALISKGLLIVLLATIFLAFNVPFSTGTIVAGFSIGYLFTIVSPTPAGVGVVEGAMTLALNTLRVPLSAATVITLAYRAFAFWLPFAYGFIAMRVLHWQWNRHAMERSAP